MIGFVNVQHSGTGFVIEHLFAGKRVTTMQNARKPVPWDLAFAHITAEDDGWIRDMLPLMRCTITTYRNDTAESWRKRKLDLSLLAAQCELMAKLQRDFDILPLHLDDAGKRDAELRAINERGGVSLVTNWRRVPSMEGARMPLGECA